MGVFLSYDFCMICFLAVIVTFLHNFIYLIPNILSAAWCNFPDSFSWQKKYLDLWNGFDFVKDLHDIDGSRTVESEMDGQLRLCLRCDIVSFTLAAPYLDFALFG